MAESRDVAWDLAELVAGAGFGDLTEGDVAATERLGLDTIATTIAGSAEPPFPTLLEHYRAEGGRGHATVMVHGGRLPVEHVVVMNSGMARALDLDDVHEAAIVHTGVHVVAAALAVAELVGTVRGPDLLAAIAVGQDVMIRLSLTCETPPILRGRPGTYVFGTFATAAVTARLLGLATEATADALGNAYARSAGTTLGYQEGAVAQRAMQGLSAAAGVRAARLAAIGVGGMRNCLEGEAGYYAVHEDGRYDRAVLTDGLGTVFHGTETALKQYPVHRGAVLDLEAALALVREGRVDPTAIRQVRVRYPARFESGYRRIAAFDPERAHPRGPVEPHFSSSWAVAVGLTQGGATVDDFTEAGVARLAAAVSPVARLVVGVPDRELDADVTGLGARVLEVDLADGTTRTVRVDHAPGGPEQPLTWDDVVAKLHDCARRSARPLRDEQLTALVHAVAALRDGADAGVLAALVT